MDAGPLSVRQIFGQDRRHLVPLFQRPYVWKRDAQWEPFWNDLRAVADALLAGQACHPHFLGAIVLDQVAKPTGHLETRLVIDGQQRLTTIQLLLDAFCDLCAASNPNYHKALVKLTRNDDPLSKDPDEQFKIWPTNVDQQHFRRVMRANDPDELRQEYAQGTGDGEIGHPIADAYLFFHERIADWLAQDEPNIEARIESLYSAIRDHIRLVVIDLDKEDDAQLIFETLNARGTPLLPSDLVKNFLFHRAQREKEELLPLYAENWESFDEKNGYWREQLGRGHARRARIDTFLQHFLTLQKKEEVPVAHLYVAFRSFAAKEAGARSVLESIRRYAQVFQSFDKQEPNSREGLFFKRISAMEQTTAYPFLLELFVRHEAEADEIRTALIDLESFLVRRMVCQLNTRGYNRLFIDLLNALGEAEGTPSSRVRGFLLASDADSRRWPNDEEFRLAWSLRPLYRRLTVSRVRMLLEALERELHSEKTEKLEFGEKLTVEHLLPQRWQQHWPPPVPVEGLEQIQPEALREDLLHAIGNLTLLTGKLNPSVSNGTWEKKHKEIMEHTALSLNRKLQHSTEWNEAAIIKRGSMLFDCATKIWPRPTP